MGGKVLGALAYKVPVGSDQQTGVVEMCSIFFLY
jgi:hypothetical protein